MNRIRNLLFGSIALCVLLFSACGDDEGSGPQALTISSITATGTDLQTGNSITLDLNGATAAEDIPLDAEVTITFSRDIDVATATSTNVSISGGSTDPAVTVSGSGSTITVGLQSDLERGTNYTLTLSGGLAAADGGAFSSSTRSFTSAGNAGVVPPNVANQLAYFNFDGNTTDAGGVYNADVSIGLTYGSDRFGNIESVATFDGNTTLIEVPNGDQLLGESFTVSYWVNVDTTDHLNANGDGNAGHFVMGVAGTAGFFIENNGSANSFSFSARYENNDQTTSNNNMFVNADGKNRDNGGWIGIEFEENLVDGIKSLIASKWAHVVITYDGTINKRSLYVNNVLLETDDLTMPTGTVNFVALTYDANAEAGITFGNKLAFGFAFDQATTKWVGTGFGDYSSATSNHFKGALDDVRFFDVAFSATDVQDLFTAESN